MRVVLIAAVVLAVVLRVLECVIRVIRDRRITLGVVGETLGNFEQVRLIDKWVRISFSFRVEFLGIRINHWRHGPAAPLVFLSACFIPRVLYLRAVGHAVILFVSEV